MTRTSPGAWVRIAFAMFAVGWGANQFSPMLIVYRHELGLAAGEVGCATAGAAIGIVAVASAGRILAAIAAALLGLAYGLCLVSGLRQAEHLAGPDERGAVIACYYAVAYLGFAVPYLAAGLAVLAGKADAFVALTAIIGLLTAGYSARLRRGTRPSEGDTRVRRPARVP